MFVSSNLTCKNAALCGGCALIKVPYEEQLKQKVAAVSALLEPYFKGEIKVTPTAQNKFYRNKIELSFTHQPIHKEPQNKKIKRDKTVPLEFEDVLGFRQMGRWDRAVNLTDCLIFNENLPWFVYKIMLWAKAKNLSFYDQRKHTGTLRTLMIRQSFNKKGGMLVFISTVPFDTTGLAEICAQIYPGFSVLTAVNDGMSDASGIKNLQVLSGTDTMQEALLFDGGKEIVFEISPQSFFQTNTKTANLMYKKVRSKVAAIKPKILYDFYGGAGSFSLTNADLVEKSFCVECVPEAVENGKKNAVLNNIKNVEFYCQTTEDFLTENDIQARNSLVILDPARAGVHPKACEKLAVCGVKNILYISCNPKTLAENLAVLTKNYTVKNAECFDFFPNTKHIETFVELVLK